MGVSQHNFASISDRLRATVERNTNERKYRADDCHNITNGRVHLAEGERHSH